jgi:hypothetical protein
VRPECENKAFVRLMKHIIHKENRSIIYFQTTIGTIAAGEKENIRKEKDEIPIAIRRDRGFVQQNFMRN